MADIVTGKVKYPIGKWRDGDKGKFASLAFEAPGYDGLQRINCKEGQDDKYASLKPFRKGQSITVVRIDRGDKSYWELGGDAPASSAGSAAASSDYDPKHVVELLPKYAEITLGIYAHLWVRFRKMKEQERYADLPEPEPKDFMMAALGIMNKLEKSDNLPT